MICLLIDDDKDDQEIFVLALEQIDRSFKCITADNAGAGLDMLSPDNAFIPDFIFLDLNMPRISGKQCLIRIKEMDHLRKVPVIIYSTSDGQRDIKETMALGAAEFITKPYSIGALSQTLSMIIDLYTPPKM
jgi:CheY-like chemotaxis protein